MTVPARRPEDDVLDRLERCFYDPRHKEDVATVRQRLAAQDARVSALRNDLETMIQRSGDWRVRAEAAEAEVQRLTGIVRDIRDSSTSSWTSPEQTLRIVAVALDALLADSPDGGGA